MQLSPEVLHKIDDPLYLQDRLREIFAQLDQVTSQESLRLNKVGRKWVLGHNTRIFMADAPFPFSIFHP